MKSKVKLYPIESGKPIVLLNEEDSRELGVYMSGRVEISFNGNIVTAIVNTTKSFVKEGEIGIFEDVQKALKVKDGDVVNIKSTTTLKSVEFIRKKITGSVLHGHEIGAIISDVVDNKLSDIELSAFVTGGYIHGYSMDEIVSLTNAIVETGQQIDFGNDIVDKHCIGGVAGNRTTMIIVPIIAAAGLTIPKTSSRAITSPAGTADTMEVLANVEFSIDEIKEIVIKTKGCIVWGGSVNLAPADDKIIRIEYPLSIDCEGHILASVMAKKKSIGSDYVIIDIPVGRGSKIVDVEKASELARKFIELGNRLDISVDCLITDGSSPIGNGVGPALEARDILLSLENKGPKNLINKSLDLAGVLLELSGRIEKGKGKDIAENILLSGKANKKMREIIGAQGGNPEISPHDIEIGKKEHVITANHKGDIRYIDNGSISHIARAAGAPKVKSAGIYLHVRVGDSVIVGDPLFTIYSNDNDKLNDAIRLTNKLNPVQVGGVILTELSRSNVHSSIKHLSVK